MSPSLVAPAPPSGSRLGLSSERIIDVALVVLDREGLAGLTMRRLGEELGVGTMTLYGYFRSKDELLDAVVDAGARRMAVAPGRGSWRERLRVLALGIRQALVDHPGIVELRLTRPLVSPGALELSEAGMSILREAGFSPRDAARAYRTLFIYAFGFSAFGPDRRGASDRELTREAVRALPPERYPALVAAAEEAAEAMDDRTLFEFGLERLLDGLERGLEDAA